MSSPTGTASAAWPPKGYGGASHDRGLEDNVRPDPQQGRAHAASSRRGRPGGRRVEGVDAVGWVIGEMIAPPKGWHPEPCLRDWKLAMTRTAFSTGLPTR